MFGKWTTAQLQEAAARLEEQLRTDQDLTSIEVRNLGTSLSWIVEELQHRKKGPQKIQPIEERRYGNE